MSAELSEALTLTQALAYFDEAEDLSFSARTTAEKCRDYNDHKQWTPAEASAIRKRKQPVITRNRIKPKVDFLKGVEIQTRTDPTASPRTPGDDNAAQTATDGVRFVYDQTKFSKIKSDVFENLIIEGAGGVEVYAKQGRKGIDVCIKRYQWDRLGWDPHSREKDFTDTLYRYAIAWMDLEQAKERYEGKADILTQTIRHEGVMSTTYDDTPRLKWADVSRKRVRIVKMEFLYEGEVWVCEFTRAGFLSEPEPSLYLDSDDVPEWSIILQSANVDRDGNRYGQVMAWLDTQDEINKRASKHLPLVSVRQTFSTKGAAGGADEIRKMKGELAKPDGHLTFLNGEYGKEFGVIPTMDMAAAQFELLQEAKQEIDSVGVHAALAGQEGRNISGRAIGKLQQGSSTELKPLYEAIAQFDNAVCRAVWNRIKQFWTEEKWIRVTGDEQSVEWIGLNVPIKDAAGNVVGLENNIAEIDVDFEITEVPDVVNAMQEQFEALTAIFPAIPEEMKPAAFEMLVESSTLRNKKKFLDKLRGNSDDPEAKALAEKQRQAAKTADDLLKAKVALTQAQTGKTQAEQVVRQVEALYAGVQTAQVAVTVPGVIPAADAIVLSAGYQDQNAAPVFPAVAANTAQAEMPVQENTDPRFPAQPVSPGVGMMSGIETQRNDGVIA